MTERAMTSADFDYIRSPVHDRAAIVLEPGKEYLVESRLVPVARDYDLDSISDLVAALRGRRRDDLCNRVIEAMTTNETSFFRDPPCFDALRDVVLPELLAARATTQTLNIWCAACSSGQEPYSIAMLLLDAFPEIENWTVRILATDLSAEMIARARAATYSQFEVNRGLPARYLPRYFVRSGTSWALNERVKEMVDFRPMNLVEPWPSIPSMDVVFLRNVLIYFDHQTKHEIFDRVHQILRSDGALFLGGAETPMNVHDGFERAPITRASCYRKSKSHSSVLVPAS